MSSEPIHQHVQVNFSYPVHFTRGLFSAGNPLLGDVLDPGGGAGGVAKLLCVVDRDMASAQPALLASLESYCRDHRSLELVCPPLQVEGGEAVKRDMAAVERVHQAIYARGIDRHSYVAAIGGGAVLDAVGFAAATAHRGVRLVRIPTTVLAQNDSGVGVKNGINAYGQKNFIGSFAPPFAVLNDHDMLTTLSDRDWRAGIAEAVKVALLKDTAFFGLLERSAGPLLGRDMPAMQSLVRRCAELHLEHIASSGDPFELGSSRPLDFGHWAAHKLEQLSAHALRHGEAVAVGIALDVTYARLTRLLPVADGDRVIALLLALGLPVYTPELRLAAGMGDGSPAFLDGLEEFREHLGGRLTISLLDRIGHEVEVHEMDRTAILHAVDVLEDRQRAARAEDPPLEKNGDVPWRVAPAAVH